MKLLSTNYLLPIYIKLDASEQILLIDPNVEFHCSDIQEIRRSLFLCWLQARMRDNDFPSIWLDYYTGFVNPVHP